MRVPQLSSGLAVGDINGDGRADIVVVSETGKAVLLLGNGRGGFHRAAGSPFLTLGGSVVAGDFDGDGHLDLAVTGETPQGQLLVETLLGNGHGRFTTGPTSLGSVPADSQIVGTSNPLVPGDFNGDGHLDLAYAYAPDLDCGPPGCPPAPDAALDVLLGNGDGGFSEAPGSPYPGGGTNVEAGHGVGGVGYNPVVGDFNRDGYSDIAQDMTVLGTPDSGEVRVLLGGPSGQMRSAPGSPFTNPYPGSLATGDVNGDGHLDFVSAGPGRGANGGYAVLLGDAAGGFREAQGSPWPLQIWQDAGSALADFNGDGRLDLVVADNPSGFSVAGSTPPGGLRVLPAGPPVADLVVTPARITIGVRHPGAVRLSAVESSEFMGPAITDYRWDLGSGHFTVDSGAVPSIRETFYRVGTYKLRLKVTDSAGHTAIGSKRLRVVPRRTRRHPH